MLAAKTYDLVTVGGGLAGSALAKAMSERGAKVLVLERETRMKDRVRGELIWPWGTTELVELGLLDVIMDSGAHEVPWIDTYRRADRLVHRNLAVTTGPKLPAISFFHPRMQEAVIEAAAAAGAEVRRGARVHGIRPGSVPNVVARIDGSETKIHARLVVGADGRNSSARRWGGFKTLRQPDQTMVAGLLFDDMPAPDDASHIFPYAKLGLSSLFFPLGHGRVRSYFCYPAQSRLRFSGKADIRRFIEQSLRTGVPSEYYAEAKAAGPIATFSGAHSWVERPYQRGLALIGDAAGTSDPTHGQGLSMAVRDARVLRDKLVADEDWDEAGRAYVEEHDRYYGASRTFESWTTRLLFETGPEADERRARALPTWPADSTRQLESFYSGPDEDLDEAARKRFFGEDSQGV